MGEFYTMVTLPKNQKKMEEKEQTISKRVKYANISIRDKSSMLRDLRHSFSLLWWHKVLIRPKDPVIEKKWSNIRKYLKKRGKGGNVAQWRE